MTYANERPSPLIGTRVSWGCWDNAGEQITREGVVESCFRDPEDYRDSVGVRCEDGSYHTPYEDEVRPVAQPEWIDDDDARERELQMAMEEGRCPIGYE